MEEGGENNKEIQPKKDASGHKTNQDAALLSDQ